MGKILANKGPISTPTYFKYSGENCLFEDSQPGFIKHHRTETAKVKDTNDLFTAPVEGLILVIVPE